MEQYHKGHIKPASGLLVQLSDLTHAFELTPAIPAISSLYARKDGTDCKAGQSPSSQSEYCQIHMARVT